MPFSVCSGGSTAGTSQRDVPTEIKNSVKMRPFRGQGLSSLEGVREEKREFSHETRHENMAWPTHGVLNFQTGLQQYGGDTRDGLR